MAEQTGDGPNALVVRGLTKTYGPKTAVDHLDLTVRQGELYALLGPNGAGKTTVPSKVAKARAEDLLKAFDLWDQRNKPCEGFSRGMKQKAALAGALIHDPKLLILDEPLTGLDASMARLIKDMLQQRVRDGGTVILTTHILEVAERLADRIGVIARGKLVAQGTLDELRAEAGADRSTLEDVFLKLIDEPPAP